MNLQEGNYFKVDVKYQNPTGVCSITIVQQSLVYKLMGLHLSGKFTCYFVM